jgi:hypothetical protein
MWKGKPSLSHDEISSKAAERLPTESTASGTRGGGGAGGGGKGGGGKPIHRPLQSVLPSAHSDGFMEEKLAWIAALLQSSSDVAPLNMLRIFTTEERLVKETFWLKLVAPKNIALTCVTREVSKEI